MNHSPMSQNRVREALEPTDKQIEAAAEAILARRGFGFYTDPMEGGQDAYDISVEALDEAAHALKAALTAPPASDAAGAEGWPAGCIKPNACARHKSCMYAMGKSQCRHYSEDLTAAIAAPTAPAQAPEDVLGYATRLAQSLCDKHYPNPEWRPLPDLYGVLTQIDNITTGLTRAATPTPPQADSTGQGDGFPTEQQLHAAMDAFYPGENWRNDLGCTLETSLRDMRAALIAAATPSQADAQTQEGGRC